MNSTDQKLQPTASPRLQLQSLAARGATMHASNSIEQQQIESVILATLNQN